MAAPSRDDPYSGFNFLVELEGVVSAGFSAVSGLGLETEVIEYRTGADAAVRKLPGLTRYPSIVLKRGLTRDVSLWEWRQAVVAGKVDRRSGSILLRDEGGQPVMRWSFVRGWPARWQGPTLDARTGEVAIETLEIAHEGLDLEAA